MLQTITKTTGIQVIDIVGPEPEGLCINSKQVWYFISKSQPGLRRSDPLRQAKLCWLATLWHHEYLAARLWHFCSRSASRRRVYVASASQYPSRSRNCDRLLIAATQSSHLNCQSRLVRSHGNNVCDVIIADAFIYQQTQKPQSKLRTSWPHAKHAAGW